MYVNNTVESFPLAFKDYTLRANYELSPSRLLLQLTFL